MLTSGEIKFVEYQKGMTGSFYTRLFRLMAVADGENLELLEKVYPEHVRAHLRYSNEKGYWELLKKRYEVRFKIKLET